LLPVRLSCVKDFVLQADFLHKERMAPYSNKGKNSRYRKS
jgi:hypothetical protein